jgi:hypothetical protein
MSVYDCPDCLDTGYFQYLRENRNAPTVSVSEPCTCSKGRRKAALERERHSDAVA